MLESKVLIVFINILQLIATLLVASEYFVSRNKLRKIEKYYTKIYGNMAISLNDKISKLNENHQHKKIENIVKLLLSIAGLVIVFIFGFYAIKNFENNVNTIYIVLVLLLFVLALSIMMYLMIRYVINLFEYSVEQLNYTLYYKVIGKFIFQRQRYPLVRLGLFLFAVSFVLNIWITLEWNKNILSLFIIFLFMSVFLYLGILYEAYVKHIKNRRF